MQPDGSATEGGSRRNRLAGSKTSYLRRRLSASCIENCAQNLKYPRMNEVIKSIKSSRDTVNWNRSDSASISSPLIKRWDNDIKGTTIESDERKMVFHETRYVAEDKVSSSITSVPTLLAIILLTCVPFHVLQVTSDHWKSWWWPTLPKRWNNPEPKKVR